MYIAFCLISIIDRSLIQASSSLFSYGIKVLVNSRKSGVDIGIRERLINRCRYLFHQVENLWLSLPEIMLLSYERMMITRNLVAILHVRNSGISSLAFTNVCLIMFSGDHCHSTLKQKKL